MAATIIDIVEGHECMQTVDGLQLTRVAKVHGLTGSKSGRGLQAMRAPGMPRIGDPHPDDPSIRVSEIHPRSLTVGMAEVSILYRTPGAGDDVALLNSTGVPEMTASLSSERTNRDWRGDKMLVKFEGHAGSFHRALYAVGLLRGTNLVQVDAQRPQIQISLMRREPNFRAVLDKAKRFSGKINSNRWGGEEPKTWLCAGVRSQRATGYYNASFVFAYREQTWDVESWYTFYGFRSTIATRGNGFDIFQVYEAVDFDKTGVRP